MNPIEYFEKMVAEHPEDMEILTELLFEAQRLMEGEWEAFELLFFLFID